MYECERVFIKSQAGRESFVISLQTESFSDSTKQKETPITNRNELASGAGICIKFAVQIKMMSGSTFENMVCRYEMLLKCFLNFIITFSQNQPISLSHLVKLEC